MAVKFLSEEWLAALKAGLQASDEVSAAAKGKEGIIQQVVTTDGEPIYYWVSFSDGQTDMGLGQIEGATITVTATYEVAAALAQDELSATAAFMSGKVDVTNLMAAMGFQGALGKFGELIREIDAEY
ncbi:MAG: SCP2 sterol-binding domain-containing protein [Actinobacteria bacterium]|nr:SCP2 sterol-binding domain-containing protein [Actinomycetota bacterium]